MKFKRKIMEKITLEYDAQNALMQSFLHTALLVGFKIVEPRPRKKAHTPFEKSLEDIKHGRITRIKNISNLLEECMQ
jgi:hypothetical protein